MTLSHRRFSLLCAVAAASILAVYPVWTQQAETSLPPIDVAAQPLTISTALANTEASNAAAAANPATGPILETTAASNAGTSPGADLVPDAGNIPKIDGAMPDAALGPDTVLPVPVLPGQHPEKNGQKASPALSARGSGELPEPKLRTTVPRLQMASAVQVAAAIVAPAPSIVLSPSQAAAKANGSQSASPNKQAGPAATPTSTPGANKTVATAAVGTTPSPTPSPKATTVASASQTTQQGPRPSAAPKASPAPAVTPVASPRPVPGITNRAVVDKTSTQPEYSLVQAPAPSAVPGPVTSLPSGAQQLSGTAGQNIDMVLSGRGWIYMGTGKTPAGVTLVEKSVNDDTEQFKFRLDTPGQLLLQFQRQDLRSGLVQKYQIALNVASRTPAVDAKTLVSLAAINSLNSLASIGTDDGTDAGADGMGNLINPSLSNLASNYVPQYSVPKDPLKQATSNGVSVIASPRPSSSPMLAVGTAATGNAGANTGANRNQNNLARSDSIMNSGTQKQNNQAITQDSSAQNQSAAAQPVAYVEPTVMPTDAEGLYKLAIARENANRKDAAREALENLVSVYPEYQNADDAMFRLAKLLESSPDNRNLRRAYELYIKIQNEYPFSKLYADAKERARYLSRMFLKS